MNLIYYTSRDACIVHVAQGLPSYDNKFGGYSADSICVFTSLSGGEIRAKVLHYAADNAAESGYRLTVVKQDGFATVEDAKAWAEATYIALSAPAVEQPAAEKTPVVETASVEQPVTTPVTIQLTIRPWSHKPSILHISTGYINEDAFPSCPKSGPEARAHVARILDAQPVGSVTLFQSVGDVVYTALWQELKARGFKAYTQGKGWAQYCKPVIAAS